MRRSYGSDDKFSAPLLMWMPLAQTYDPELHVVPSNAAKQQLGGSSSSKFADIGSPNSSSKDVEYVVTEDAPIWQHIRRMLRPFLAVPALRQQPPAADEAAAAAGGDADAAQAMQQDDEQQQQQVGPGDAAGDVSMAAASGLPGSAVENPSPEPCCTSRPSEAAEAPSAAAAAAVAKAGSEAGEDNSTWGSHGSDSPRSDVDMTGLDEAAAAVAAGIADEEQGAAAAGTGATPPVSSPQQQQQQQQQQQSDGEEDAGAATAALAMQELGAAGGGSSENAAAAAGSGMLGQGGVPVQPLDIWAAQPQVQLAHAADLRRADLTLHGMLCDFKADLWQ
jgi:hypothetical protein